jgi:hypothetical protein
MMSFIERYKNGETREVYQDIYELGEKAFDKDILPDVEAVLTETFGRVRYNLEVIYEVLKEMDYQFKTEFEYTSDYPIAEPVKNCDKLLTKLDKTVKPFGYVPLSFKLFYKIVGSCNFAWDYETNENIIWEYADPIQIEALDDLFEYPLYEGWVEEMKDILVEEEETDSAYIEFSADYYHKDNVSGGMGYAIEITKKPSIDSKVLFEEHDTTFIEYLRLTFENCGFIRIKNPEYGNDFSPLFEKVKHKLKEI